MTAAIKDVGMTTLTSPIIQDSEGVQEVIGSVAMVPELAAALTTGTLVIAPATVLEAGGDSPAEVATFGVFARNAAAPQPMPIERDGINHMHTLADLPLDEAQKMLVLEWFARKLWVILEEGSGDPDYYGKSYDPLVIEPEEKLAHSYVFSLGENGGCHHPFTDLLDLEEKLKQEGIEWIRTRIVGQ